MIEFLDYELLDFGNGRKLERFGDIILDRPESTAEKSPKANPSLWSKSNHIFLENKAKKGNWDPPENMSWTCSLKAGQKKLSINLHKGAFKHIGIFPEQINHWNRIANSIGPGKKMLNLFAYTGVSSIIGSLCGAEVTHIDSSKSILKLAKENALDNQTENIRFIQEDALKFSRREQSRGNQYDLVICDPPVYGRGAKKEIWKLEKDLAALLDAVSSIMASGALLILNTYSPRLSVEDMVQLSKNCKLKVETKGWLTLKSASEKELKFSKYICARKWL